jgi:SAM-dependent methyltransferase
MERGLAFDGVAEVYDRVRPRYPDRLLDVALGDRPIRDVLEVGCGSGQLTVDLVARRLRVEAVEPGAKLASIARRRAPDAQIHVARFEDLELADASFDALFSATAFHWVDPRVGWAKAARVLRQGGILALLGHVYVTDDETRSAQEALRDVYEAPWRLREPKDLIDGAGARLENISDLWGWVENPAIAVAVAGKLFGEAHFDAVPRWLDLTAAELLDLQRTTATHLSLDAPRRERVERGISELVARLGGSFPIRQLAVLAVAERR